MTDPRFIREEALLGPEAMDTLHSSHVAVFGLGGVGSWAAEALARSGVGRLTLVDFDTVSITNINRQLYALTSTIDRPKAEIAAARIRDICPETAVNRHCCFFLPETAEQFDFSQYDYVIDAIDTVKGKLEIILRAKAAGVPVISCMGAGNKLDPTALRVADIYKTKVCPLARVMRYELRRRGVDALKVVYSEEPPAVGAPPEGNTGRRSTPGSVMFVPAAAGLILAGEVIRDLAGIPRG